MLKQIFYLLGILVLIAVGILLIYITIKTLIILIKCKFKDIRKNIKETRYINIIEFIKWVFLDLKRGKDYFKLFGIWCFTGYYGQGKSLGAVNYAFELKKKYPYKNIKIYSNFKIEGQDGRITKWQDLLELPRNTIVVFDEIQSTFTSQKYKDFPIDLLWKLTQCRKHGLAIFCTSPIFSRISIQLRESTDYVIISKNILKLDRWFTYEFFHGDMYENYLVNNGGLFDAIKRRQAREMKYTLVAQDYNYSRYDTEQQIDRWDIEDENQKKKNVSKYTYEKLRNELIKEIEFRIKQIK